jgi:hypothetical protein
MEAIPVTVFTSICLPFHLHVKHCKAKGSEMEGKINMVNVRQKEAKRKGTF